jgi:hypothetical protein
VPGAFPVHSESALAATTLNRSWSACCLDADMGVLDSMLLTKHDNGDRKFKLATALRHYTGQAIENAHNAEGDVVATMRVLQAALRRWVC